MLVHPCLQAHITILMVQAEQSLHDAGETKEGYYQPLEKAELVRQGKDVTILCYSRMRYVVMQAVQQLEKMGYDPEVHAHLL